jgi:hypothetical protein
VNILKLISKKPKAGKPKTHERSRFANSDPLNDQQAVHIEKRNPIGHNPLAYGFFLSYPQKPPGRIKRTFSAIAKAAQSSADFFSGAAANISLIYNLIRYPDFIKNVLSSTYPPQSKKKEDE